MTTSALYSIRLFVYGSRGYLCNEEIVTHNDPFVMARRALILDEMSSDGAGYNRARIYKLNIWPEGESYLGTVRLRKDVAERWRTVGAIQRGVRNAGLKKLAAEQGVPYPAHSR
jgi:hypothetical protein